jgi:hypothetical protein
MQHLRLKKFEKEMKNQQGPSPIMQAWMPNQDVQRKINGYQAKSRPLL